MFLCIFLCLTQPALAWTTFRVGLYCGFFIILAISFILAGKSRKYPGSYIFHILLSPEQFVMCHSKIAVRLWQMFIIFPPSSSYQNIHSGLSGAVFFRLENIWPLVRIYRGGFLLIQFIFLLGINTYGWRQAGVNHVLIFEINPRNNLSHQHLFEVSE